jgi:hypothetical protein
MLGRIFELRSKAHLASKLSVRSESGHESRHKEYVPHHRGFSGEGKTTWSTAIVTNCFF